MTEPRLNEDGQQPATDSDMEAQHDKSLAPALMPIAEDAAEPKAVDTPRARKTPSRKMKRPPAAVIAVVTLVVLALAGLVGWRLLTGFKPLPQETYADAKVQGATPQNEKGADAATPPIPDEGIARPDKAAGPLAVYSKGSLAKLITYPAPTAVPDISFIDRDKKPLSLSTFKGQVVVLNLWATWCAPCRFEMPTLAHLQTLYTGKDLKVLPLSVDTEEQFDKVKSFIDVQQPLDIYADQNFQAPTKFSAPALPATLILDKQGRIVARLDGEAKWDTPEVQALLDKLLAE